MDDILSAVLCYGVKVVQCMNQAVQNLHFFRRVVVLVLDDELENWWIFPRSRHFQVAPCARPQSVAYYEYPRSESVSQY